MAIGGSGGSGQTGGAVVVTNNRFIDTFGIGSHGIFAQSIGGGGGTGGDARSMILSIDPSNWGPEQPELPDPMSISVGATLSVGGSGGTAADGGTVNICNHQRIVTRGADAYGILAQSIGGGGGIGGGGYHGLDWKDFGVSEETEQYLELLPSKAKATCTSWWAARAVPAAAASWSMSRIRAASRRAVPARSPSSPKASAAAAGWAVREPSVKTAKSVSAVAVARPATAAWSR
jgi:hypothetical protein